MARTDERFREAYNALLDLCATLRIEETLPSELALADTLDVSRTVVRSALQRLNDEQIIIWEGRTKRMLRKPRKTDRLPIRSEPVSEDELEQRFLDWILRFDVAPGTPLNVSDLARQFAVSPHALQEFMASLSRFGLVQRRRKGGWELSGFTTEFAVELSDFRTMLELNAISTLMQLPRDHTIWAQLDQLERDHHALADQLDQRYHDFSLLDERFHTTLGSVVQNRFVAEFQKVISLIFHYHYQWDKKDERDRNAAALHEHLNILDAIRTGDEAAALSAGRMHLKTSKQTLLASLRIHARS